MVIAYAKNRSQAIALFVWFLGHASMCNTAGFCLSLAVPIYGYSFHGLRLVVEYCMSHTITS